MNSEMLSQEAIAARKHAYAPYSGFCVGAAVLADNGKIYSGCNIENASYGATLCAERTAIAKAVSDGVRRIVGIAVIGDSTGEVTPCGICRQVIAEFASPETPVWCGNRDGLFTLRTLQELLPFAFTPADLADAAGFRENGQEHEMSQTGRNCSGERGGNGL